MLYIWYLNTYLNPPKHSPIQYTEITHSPLAKQILQRQYNDSNGQTNSHPYLDRAWIFRQSFDMRHDIRNQKTNCTFTDLYRFRKQRIEVGRRWLLSQLSR